MLLRPFRVCTILASNMVFWPAISSAFLRSASFVAFAPLVRRVGRRLQRSVKIFGVDPADPPMVAQTVGCDDCRFTGYKGRVAVHEMLRSTSENR